VVVVVVVILHFPLVSAQFNKLLGFLLLKFLPHEQLLTRNTKCIGLLTRGVFFPVRAQQRAVKQ